MGEAHERWARRAAAELADVPLDDLTARLLDVLAVVERTAGESG